jgi:outer membrane murein-binding lipoprotein Lpp
MTVKLIHTLAVGATVLLAMMMAGCSTQAKRVDCDGELKPINRPAPQAAAPAHPPKNSTDADEK